MYPNINHAIWGGTASGSCANQGDTNKGKSPVLPREVYIRQLRPPAVWGMHITIFPVPPQINKALALPMCGKGRGSRDSTSKVKHPLRSAPCLEELAAYACPLPPWDKQTGFCLSSFHATLPTW